MITGLHIQFYESHRSVQQGCRCHLLLTESIRLIPQTYLLVPYITEISTPNHYARSSIDVPKRLYLHAQSFSMSIIRF